MWLKTTELMEEWAAWSSTEVVAVVFAILYLLLAIRQNIWCWFFAGASTAIFIFVFAAAKFYMEAALNVFYFGMAIFGWITWRTGAADEGRISISTLPPDRHWLAIVTISSLAAIAGFLLFRYTDAQFPFIDSAIAFASIWATFLVARKVLENWWYWLVIDLASIFIFWSRNLDLTALLYGMYVIMIPFGLVSWTRSRNEQREAVET